MTPGPDPRNPLLHLRGKPQLFDCVKLLRQILESEEDVDLAMAIDADRGCVTSSLALGHRVVLAPRRLVARAFAKWAGERRRFLFQCP